MRIIQNVDFEHRHQFILQVKAPLEKVKVILRRHQSGLVWYYPPEEETRIIIHETDLDILLIKKLVWLEEMVETGYAKEEKQEVAHAGR